MRFPNRTSTIGTLINTYLTTSTSQLNDQTIHLLFSANRWEAAANIESVLSAGTSIVCDRYAFSGVSYSTAKHLDMSWCMSCDRGLPAPDAVIFLDIAAEDAAERGNYGEERYEKLEFQREVQTNFAKLRHSTNDATPWFVLDAKRVIDDLHNEIENIVKDVTENVKYKPIAKLWL